MRKTLFGLVLGFFAVAALAMTYPPAQDLVLGQQRIAGQVHIGDVSTPVALDGQLIANNPKQAGTIALTSGTPSTATVTVAAGARCFCVPQGGTAAIAAAGCATSLSSTTLTLTGPNTVTTTVAYFCF